MSGRLLAGSLAVGAAQVALVTLLARIVGFGRWAVFEPAVGAGPVGSAYATANVLPNAAFEVVAGGALVGAVVPLLAGPLLAGGSGDGGRAGGGAHGGAHGGAGRAEADRTASALLTWAVTVLVPVAVALAVAAGPLTALALAAGGGGTAGGAQQALAARLLAVFAPQVVLYGVGAVLTGVLAAHRRFLAAAVAPLASSLVVVGAYLVFAAVGGAGRRDPATLDPAAEAVLAWGTTAGVAVLTLPLLVPVARAGVRLRPTWRFPPGVAARARRLAAAGLVALVAQQASVLALLVAANGVDRAGGYVVLLYAQAVQLLPHGVLVVPLATVAFPALAAAAAAGERAGFARTAALSTRAVVLVAAAGATALAAAAPATGRFFAALSAPEPSSALGALPGLLTALAPGVVGLALVTHLGRALYALERGRSAGLVTAAGWLLVAAGALLAPPALAWLGAATSAGLALSGAGLLVALRTAAGPAATAGVPRTLAAAAAGAVLGAVAARALVASGAVGGAPAVAGADRGPLAAAAAALDAGLAAALALGVLAAVVALADRPALAHAASLLRRRGSGAPVGAAP